MNDQWFKLHLYNAARNCSYFAVDLLDEGGFGEVWDGITSAGLHVALKVMKPTSDFFRDFKSWYTDQQVHLQSLNHPNIVVTYDQFVSADGRLVIVMERAGGSLHSLLTDRYAFTPIEVCRVGCAVLSALHHIHSLRVIHRDVTPKNILYFADGAVKLNDFGISRTVISAGELARTLIGQPSFISPELYRANYSTFQSDIYQTGLVLLTLLCGTYVVPLEAPRDQVRQMVLDGIPRATAESLTTRFGNLATVISVMLRRTVEWRYQTALHAWSALNAELERIVKAEQLLPDWYRQMRSQNPRLPMWPSHRKSS